ncbi:MAG: rhomboid family intramembrane serine protease [Oscillospiraceae bacterium]|nr:rhomboid family intramembrane serine protease [Oscillospiraceae bacterium]
MKRRGFTIDFNAPVILWLTVIALAVVVVDFFTGGLMISLFASRRTSWVDPMQYLRLFTHIFVHGDLAHYVGNFMMILAIGPMVEEKYGSRNLVWFIAITTFITGLANILLFPAVATVGASGIVFMLILLASFTNIRQGRLPITVPLVAVLYLGNEILTGIFTVDNISQLSHIIGGLCGAVAGGLFHSRTIKAID